MRLERQRRFQRVPLDRIYVRQLRLIGEQNYFRTRLRQRNERLIRR